MNKDQLIFNISGSLINLKVKDLRQIQSLINSFSKPTTAKKTQKVLQDIEVISTTGVVSKHRNGGWGEEIILKNSRGFWKISILSESFDFQSYGKLYFSKDLNDWNIIKTINPKRDYNIDISYQEIVSNDTFKKIIDDFKDLINKL